MKLPVSLVRVLFLAIPTRLYRCLQLWSHDLQANFRSKDWSHLPRGPHRHRLSVACAEQVGIHLPRSGFVAALLVCQAHRLQADLNQCSDNLARTRKPISMLYRKLRPRSCVKFVSVTGFVAPMPRWRRSPERPAERVTRVPRGKQWRDLTVTFIKPIHH